MKYLLIFLLLPMVASAQLSITPAGPSLPVSVANGGTGGTTSTGSGAAVLATSPTLVTPVLGAATVTSLNGVTTSGSGTTALWQFAAPSGSGAKISVLSGTGTNMNFHYDYHILGDFFVGYPGTSPRLYMDFVNNRTSVGHTANSQPAGTKTFNVEGTYGISGASTFGTAGTAVTNVRHGISGAMTLGAVTVTDAGCTANTRYSFSAHSLGTISVPGGYYASTRNAGTSFVITSSQPTETSTIDWTAVEP